MADNETSALETIFLTGPGGQVYELPLDDAARYRVSPQRIQELGHLPIIPYGSGASAGAAPAPMHEADVEGRHLVHGYDQWSGTVRHHWHFEVVFGTYLGVDGKYYQGPHYHPYQTEIGIPR